MKVEFLGTKGNWQEVASAAYTTIHREAGDKEPSSAWKRRMLLCEHSPIRHLQIKGKWHELMYWVSVHLVRHKFGIEHWVRTQRTDRTGVGREELPQGNLVEHEILANAQAMISISRKRLCKQASPETREAWAALLESMRAEQPELFSVCVPDCVYRGWCYEYKSCGYHRTDDYRNALAEYRNGINGANPAQ